MMALLLDTNVISDIARHPFGSAASRVLERRGETLFTSIIVVAEIHFGLAKSGSARLAQIVGGVLDLIRILPFEAPADEIYGRLRADLERSGQLIGPNDLLIAAQCLAGDFMLVTDNIREFSRVPGLKVENWIR
ncbi:VapC toxin family PIN domain ribonuclease [Kaistia algarum]|uniref:type II toxin-antitoxin system VapC family toxin n=1 Tax=Kaistia algarum TaxID=2083279 RepID=UPI000CE9086C|nr:type II toxin-antitoxin system VapC family toxin [Kaistia algarum]MCX5514621.1 type II toxin-antitoxin system VapC family toxin [Kaistia algarum]PPE79010.1 VapC toxin family PIN domain ribonuclease [Kaistia algarum]